VDNILDTECYVLGAMIIGGEKACIKRLRAEPRVPHSGPKRELPWMERMGVAL